MTGTIRPSSPSDTAMPRLTSVCTVSWSPSSHALSAGYSRSASMLARGHERQRRQPGLAAARSTRDMSASIHVVHVAAVSSERFMWLADELAHARQRRGRRRLVGAALDRGARGPAAGGRRRRGRLAARPARACRATRCAAAAPRRPAHRRRPEGEDVLLAHAPVAPGALHLVKVDVVLGRVR
jgi:hypothetical protein